MSKKETKKEPAAQEEEVLEKETPETEQPEAEKPQEDKKAEQKAEKAASGDAEIEKLQKQLKESEEKYLRLAAEYDNYRKRTAKEKESAWTDAKVDTVKALLPVYDNLERAIKQETADAAYQKGVEMTMNQLTDELGKLGITEIPALGQPFDPNLHNAVMHVDDENLGENTIAQVFQAGFQCGEKVVRFAMVQVAN